MERHLRNHVLEFILVLALIVFVVLNSTMFFQRFDLTSTKAYTISQVSRSLFRELPNRVSITYYLSDGLRRRIPEVQEIEDLLREYAAYSRGTISVRTVDPLEEGIEEVVQQLGVVPQQFQVVEDGEQSFSQVYTGIVIEYLDRFEVLPVVIEPRSIEYELTSTIRQVVREETRSIGVIIGREDAELEGMYRLMAERLSRNFEVRRIGQGEPIAPDLSALFVLGHRDLDDYDLYPIDQYLIGGNPVLFASDGVFVDVQPTLQAQTATTSPLLQALSAYGFTIEPSIVMDRSFKRIPITRQMGNATVQSYEPYPQWISLQTSTVNQEHPITARFSGLDLLWASPVGVREDLAEEAATILVSTTTDAWLMNQPYVINPLDRAAFERDAQSTSGPYDVAVAFTGGLTSYFADRDPPAADGRPAIDRIEHRETAQTRMVIVGDSLFASDYIRASDSGYNLAFLENVAEWLVNDEDLLSIRTRSQRPMALDRIQDPEMRSRTADFARILNIFIIPFAVALFGVIRLAVRRRRSQSREAT